MALAILIFKLRAAIFAPEHDRVKRLLDESVQLVVQIEVLSAVGTGAISIFPLSNAFKAGELAALAAFLGLLYDHQTNSAG